MRSEGNLRKILRQQFVCLSVSEIARYGQMLEGTFSIFGLQIQHAQMYVYGGAL